MKHEINWDEFSQHHGNDRAEYAAKLIGELEYIKLSEVLVNRDKGAPHLLKMMDHIYGCGDGVRTPSKQGVYRLKPYREFIVDGSWEYKPGDVVEWKQQEYTRLPMGIIKGGSKKKLTRDDIESMRRRGEVDKLIDIGSAVVDEHGLITVSYQDAAQLLSNNGFIRHNIMGKEQVYGICHKPEVTNRQVRHETEEGKMVRQTRRNWLFEEVYPWNDPANKPKRGRPATNEG